MNPESKQVKKQSGIGLRFLCLALILCGVTACGKKGPLYLPPGIIPVLKPEPESTVKSMVKPVIRPPADAPGKTSPSANKQQP